MQDDYLKPGFDDFYDPERRDREETWWYLPHREIWSVRIRKPPEQHPNELRDDFGNRFGEVFHEHFEGADVPTRPEHQIFFGPTPHVESDVLFAQIVVTNITDDNRRHLRALFDLIKRGDVDSIKDAENLTGATDQLCRAAQPANWGGGGPGGLPIPQLGPVQDEGLNSGKPTPYDFVLPDRLQNTGPGLNLSDFQANYGGENVLVAILDTAPHPDGWAAAVQKFDKHPVIKSLDDMGDFEIRYETASIFPLLTAGEEKVIADKMQQLGLPSQPMVDHGLFVAGIIHSIAPKASIKLLRILNDNGTGLQSVVGRGLSAAIDVSTSDVKYTGKPLIINCSLNMVLALADKYRDMPGGVEQDWALFQAGNTIVGAAGNEGLDRTRPDGSKPPYPRYPAGFNGTLGVTALNQNYSRASYANWAEDYNIADAAGAYPVTFTGPDRVGIATTGGETLSFGHVRITHPLDSVLGLYISNDGLPGLAYSILGQHNGWARWAGTSFANAIVSGVLALIASYRYANQQAFNQADLVTDLLKYCEPRLTQKGINSEYVLKVTQGT
jgi:hypothetical protein